MNTKTNQIKQSTSSLEEILQRGNKQEVRALFSFTIKEPEEKILLKFNLWSRYFFPQYFKAKDAPFHKDIDTFNLRTYTGKLKYFVDIVFRGGAKSTRTKLFLAFALANNQEHFRKYLKVNTKDLGNAKQAVTDIYNMLISQAVSHYYPEIFEKTVEKREETMASFTTATGVKIKAGTVGMEQRGMIQEDARPDLIWFDDFETRNTLRSAVTTQAIWDNMEEARTGLSKDGGAIYTCNYVSERGNVHRLVEKKSENKEILIVPIKFNNKPMWEAYTIEEINQIEKDADDFEGEYLCLKPNTQILTPNGWKEISSLHVGDFVISHKNREQKILHVFNNKSEDLLDITVLGKRVTITRNHPVLVFVGRKYKWVEAGKLKVGDFVVSIPHDKLNV